MQEKHDATFQMAARRVGTAACCPPCCVILHRCPRPALFWHRSVHTYTAVGTRSTWPWPLLHESMVAATLSLQSARSSSACIASTSGRPWTPLRAAAAAAAGLAGRRQQQRAAAAAAGGRGMSSPVQAAAVSEQATAPTNGATGAMARCLGRQDFGHGAQVSDSLPPRCYLCPTGCGPTDPTAAATAACVCSCFCWCWCRACCHCEA